jgi:hypothetical protein
MSGERLITPEYRDWLKDLKLRVRQAQVRAEPSLRQGYGGQAGRVGGCMAKPARRSGST